MKSVFLMSIILLIANQSYSMQDEFTLNLHLIALQFEQQTPDNTLTYCEFCNTTIEKIWECAEMQYHLETQHFRCSKCKHQCKSALDVRIHKKLNHTDNEKNTPIYLQRNNSLIILPGLANQEDRDKEVTPNKKKISVVIVRKKTTDQ